MRRPPGHDMLQRPRRLRREMTDAERRLWSALRDRRLQGFKFRSQMWLCGYIADFCCVEAKLVVEADGGQHGEQLNYDAERTAAFRREGFHTLRFWNNDILNNLDGVLLTIGEALPSPSHPLRGRAPPSPLQGEGF